jgi:hypothetical protein
LTNELRPLRLLRIQSLQQGAKLGFALLQSPPEGVIEDTRRRADPDAIVVEPDTRVRTTEMEQ